MSNAPSLSEVVARGVAWPVNVAVIVTPGTTAPDGSFTTPRIDPFVCPMAAAQNAKLTHASRHTRTHAIAFISAPFENFASTPDAPGFFDCRFPKNLTIIREP